MSILAPYRGIKSDGFVHLWTLFPPIAWIVYLMTIHVIISIRSGSSFKVCYININDCYFPSSSSNVGFDHNVSYPSYLYPSCCVNIHSNLVEATDRTKSLTGVLAHDTLSSLSFFGPPQPNKRVTPVFGPAKWLSSEADVFSGIGCTYPSEAFVPRFSRDISPSPVFYCLPPYEIYDIPAGKRRPLIFRRGLAWSVYVRYTWRIDACHELSVGLSRWWLVSVLFYYLGIISERRPTRAMLTTVVHLWRWLGLAFFFFV